MTRAIGGVRAALALVSVCGAFVLARETPVRAAETIAIRGRISAVVRGPVERAVVDVRDDGGRELHLTSDRDGRYVAIGLSAGIVDVTVSHAGFVAQSQSCRVRDGETLRLDFELVRETTDTADRRDACRIEPQSADRYVIP